MIRAALLATVAVRALAPAPPRQELVIRYGAGTSTPVFAEGITRRWLYVRGRTLGKSAMGAIR